MAGVLDNVIDVSFALIIIGLFIFFIWSRVTKQGMGELFNRMVAFFNTPVQPKIKTEKKQLWQEKRTRI